MKKIMTILSTLSVAVLASGVALAEGHAAGSTGGSSHHIAYAAALVMSIAAAFGTFSQSRAAAAALEGITRNPQSGSAVQVPLIISLALMESLVILSFVIANTLAGKI